MIRTGSQFVFCSPEQILRRSVIEQDEHNRITRIFSLDNTQVETSHTLFFDGVLSAQITSLKHQLSPDSFKQMMSDYQYIDFEGLSSEVISKNENPFVFDFGTTETDKINTQLSQKYSYISKLSLFEIVAACTYYPTLICNLSSQLSIGNQTQLLLWENVDLVSKRITSQTRIRIIQ